MQPQFTGIRFKYAIGDIDTHHTVNSRAEVETDHLTAGGALNARIFSGQTIAGGQAALVQFEDKIAAAILVGDCRTG